MTLLADTWAFMPEEYPEPAPPAPGVTMTHKLRSAAGVLLYTFNPSFKRTEDDDFELSVRDEKKSWAHGGILKGDRMPVQKVVTLEGFIAEGTKALTDAEMRELEVCFYNENLRLYRPGDDYYLPIRSLQKMQRKPVPGQYLRAWELKLSLLATDPFWYGAAEIDDPHALAASPATFNVVVSSPVNWEVPARIEITGTDDLTAGVTVKNNTTNQQFTFTDPNFTGGQTLEVDSKLGLVELDGAERVKYFVGSFPMLAPGTNSLTVTGNLAASTITVYWTPRFF